MRDASKIIFDGQEGSGKTLRMARYANRVLYINARYLKKTRVPRPIFSNFKFSRDFEKKAEKFGVPVIYWKNLDELVGKTGCDIFIDEIGTYFDSRLWTELSLDVRRWIAQCDKNGVNMYGTAQDFAQVDKAFRRLVKKLYRLQKYMGSPRPHPTYPRVSSPWGLFNASLIDAKGYKEDEPKMKGSFLSWLGGFFWLSKDDYSVFDTNATVVESAPMPLKHVQRHCETCGLEKIVHY